MYVTIQDYMGPYQTIGDHRSLKVLVSEYVLVNMYVCMYVSEFSIHRVAHATKNQTVVALFVCFY